MTYPAALVWQFSNFKAQFHLTCYKHQSCNHIKISQLIRRANQLAGFYMLATLAFNELS